MYLKLKNTERTFEVEAPIERTVKGAETVFWVITLKVKELLTTEEIDELFCAENTEEMTFVTPLPNGTEYEYVVSGYTKKVFSIIKHENNECELQFSKEAAANA